MKGSPTPWDIQRQKAIIAMLSRAFGIEATFPRTSWPLRQNKKGGTRFFFRLIWLMNVLVVQNGITSESHRIYLPWLVFKKNMYFWGQIPLGTQDSIKVVGSRGGSFERHDGPHPTASHLHPKSGFQPESLQFPHEVSRISNVRTGSHSGKPVDQIPTCKPGILKLQLGEGMGCVHKSILSHHSAKGHNGSCNPNKSRAHRKRCYSWHHRKDVSNPDRPLGLNIMANLGVTKAWAFHSLQFVRSRTGKWTCNILQRRPG